MVQDQQFRGPIRLGTIPQYPSTSKIPWSDDDDSRKFINSSHSKDSLFPVRLGIIADTSWSEAPGGIMQ